MSLSTFTYKQRVLHRDGITREYKKTIFIPCEKHNDFLCNKCKPVKLKQK